MASELTPTVQSSNPEEESSLLPADLFGMLWRRKWLMLAMLLLGVSLGASYLRVAPRNYLVTARLFVSPQAVPTFLDQEPAGNSRFLATQAEIIRSPAVLDPAYRSLNLPDEKPAPPHPVMRMLREIVIEPLMGKPAAPPDPIHKIMESLEVMPTGGTEVLTIIYTDTEGERAKRLVAAILKSYQDYLREVGQTSQLQSLRLIRQQEAQSRAELTALADRYRALRAEIAQADRGEETLQLQTDKLVRLGEQITETQFNRQEVERLVGPAASRQLNDLKAREQALRDLYGEEYQHLKEIHAYQAQEQHLRARIERGRAAYEAVVAQREKMQLLEQSLLAGRLPVAIRVLEAPVVAVPQMALPPVFVLGMCGLLGLALGAGVAVWREGTPLHVVSAEQVQQQFGLPVVAGIPWIKAPRRMGDAALFRGRLVCQTPDAAAVDAFRTLRTRMLYRTPGSEGWVELFASPVNGEGKTTLAANLAASFAQIGKKVVVVDADLCHGAQHRIFHTPNDVGLSSVLAQGLAIPEALARSPLAPLDVLARGPAIPNPVELLSRPELARVLAWLRRSYDLVVLDGPSLLLDTAGLLLAYQADELLLCLRSGRSSFTDTASACGLLDELNKRPWGIVLNEAPHDRRRRNRPPPPSVAPVINGTPSSATPRRAGAKPVAQSTLLADDQF